MNIFNLFKTEEEIYYQTLKKKCYETSWKEYHN